MQPFFMPVILRKHLPFIYQLRSKYHRIKKKQNCSCATYTTTLLLQQKLIDYHINQIQF